MISSKVISNVRLYLTSLVVLMCDVVDLLFGNKTTVFMLYFFIKCCFIICAAEQVGTSRSAWTLDFTFSNSMRKKPLK